MHVLRASSADASRAGPPPGAVRLADRLLEQVLGELAEDAARTAIRELASAIVAQRRALSGAAAHVAAAAAGLPPSASLPIAVGAGYQAARAAAASASTLGESPLRALARARLAHSTAPLPPPQPPPEHAALLEHVLAPLLAEESKLAARAATSELVDEHMARRKAERLYNGMLLPSVLSTHYVRQLATEAACEHAADELLGSVLREEAADSALDALSECAAEASNAWLSRRKRAARGARPRQPREPPLRLPHLSSDPEAWDVDKASQAVVLERLILDALMHTLVTSGESVLVRDAMQVCSDEWLSEILMHRALSVAQRREEAAPSKPLGAAHAQLTTELLLEAMVAGLARLPVDEEPADARQPLLPLPSSSPPSQPAPPVQASATPPRTQRAPTRDSAGTAKSTRRAAPASTSDTVSDLNTEPPDSSGSGSESGSRSATASSARSTARRSATSASGSSSAAQSESGRSRSQSGSESQSASVTVTESGGSTERSSAATASSSASTATSRGRGGRQ